MQFPPQQQNEPEWLQVQRRRRKEDRNLNYGGWAAMALAAIPYAITEVMLRASRPGLFGLVGLSIAAALAIAAIFSFRRAAKGSFQSSFAGWSMVAHGVCALVFLIMTFQGL